MDGTTTTHDSWSRFAVIRKFSHVSPILYDVACEQNTDWARNLTLNLMLLLYVKYYSVSFHEYDTTVFFHLCAMLPHPTSTQHEHKSRCQCLSAVHCARVPLLLWIPMDSDAHAISSRPRLRLAHVIIVKRWYLPTSERVHAANTTRVK